MGVRAAVFVAFIHWSSGATALMHTRLCLPRTFADWIARLIQVIQVEDIPYTINGKRVEVPVKKVSR